MDNTFHWDILDRSRQDLLPLFELFSDRFYLAGGTGLALQLGHRDSIDFDFFSSESFDTSDLFKKAEEVFAEDPITKTQEAKDTLSFTTKSGAKVSFLGYPYKLVRPLLDGGHLKIASIEDIACMKLTAITSRSVLKDYIDLYFILHQIDLAELLDLSKQKYPTLDANLILKSLVYFDDIEDEPIIFKTKEVGLPLIKKFLTDTVKSYLSKN